MARTHVKIIASVLVGFVTACSPARYKTYYIPSESMSPTLQVNDRIMADQTIYQTAMPQRGDIVVFRPPAKLIEMMQGAIKIDSDTVFVKRVIGLPGEVVSVKQGKVYIDNQPLQEAYTLETPDYTWGPMMVPSDSFVVLGDNRNNAFDSHYWGTVPRDHLRGKVFFRYWPPNRMGIIEP